MADAVDIPTSSHFGPPLSFPEAKVDSSYTWWLLCLIKCLDLSPLSLKFLSSTTGACSDCILGSPKQQRTSCVQGWPLKMWDWILWINMPTFHSSVGWFWGSSWDYQQDSAPVAHYGKLFLSTFFIKFTSFPVWVSSYTAWTPWDYFSNKLLSTNSLSWDLILVEPKMRQLLTELRWW